MKRAIFTFILSLMLVITSIPAFAQGASNSGKVAEKYPDIKKGYWAEGAINKYADKSIFAGKDGRFNPMKPITRSEFVIMLHKALGIQIKYFKAPDIKEFYSDVKNGDACALPLYDLVVSNIIDYKGKFKPNSTLPRDEMVHYIMNALKSMTGGKYAVIKMMPAPFADDNKIAGAYKNDIIEAVLLKLVGRNEKNMFYPQANTTRAEAAAIIERLINTADKFNTNIDIVPSAVVQNDSLKMKLTIKNNSSKPVTFEHSSGQKYDFVLLDSNLKELYRWSAGKFFTMMVTHTTIDAGNSIEYSETLDGDTYKNIKDKVSSMKAYFIAKSDAFTVNPDGYEAIIK